jgi:LytS/YehU family sensor histidine kinase
MLLFLLTTVVHYLIILFEEKQQAETRALELRVLSKEAELKSLRAQLQPHFLFNSLNSISALTASDPEGARRMCVLLGDFLRQGLKLGARDTIALREEIELLEKFLAVEKIRFGARLSTELRADPDALACGVPPLLLQPLVENAIGHGIATLVEGGAVRVEARVRGGRLWIVVENPRDPDAQRRTGEGVGLENVKRRLLALHGREARVDAIDGGGSFRVELELPASAVE